MPTCTRRRLLQWAAATACGAMIAACGVEPTPTPQVVSTPVPIPTLRPPSIAGPVPPGKGFVTGPDDRDAPTLTGAGATFPAALYSRWFDDYFRLTGVRVNYQSIGSGGGIKAITDRTVDFGASDAPMNDKQLRAVDGEVLHVPSALGAVVPTYNVPELAEPLRLTPETLAGIFLGEIEKWNDPRLVAENPKLADVDRYIIVIHRSDGSGTTYVFVDYLSAISPAWKERVGVGTAVQWPVGLGAKGNEGVAGEVKQTTYAIGYVELIYATQNQMGVAWMRNQAGRFVEPKIESVSASAAGIADRIAPDLRASIVNAPGENAYPISAFTYLLPRQVMTDRSKAVAVARMLWWGIHDAQRLNAQLGYAPIPDRIVVRAAEKVLLIRVGDERALPSR